MYCVTAFLLAFVSLSQAERPAGLKFQQVIRAYPSQINNGTVKDPSAFSKPAFCGDLDCPAYTVKASTDDYELREYGPTKWFQTALTGIDYDSAQYQMFMKLFQYISGDNVGKKKIAMTVPVIVRIIPGQGPACEDNFTMSFYVAETDVPAPSNPDVKIVSMASIDAYVAGFSGFAKKDTYIQAALALGKKLKQDKKAFTDSFYFTAGYDAPFKLFNRHNEVWFLAA